ncbi:MAG TPA: acyltransferase family protein [Acidimicrobiales bacterium]|nr:acyltransferase family protein [Acidimicrobiales bacterium]
MTDKLPTAVTGRHLPALNGLRALAVLAVMAYHLQLGWARGGYLGVDLFFVLSGFLITTLLLEEWTGTGTIRLANFWARRARRLLPALFLVLVGLAIYLVVNANVGSPGANGLIDLNGLRGDALATLFYVGNWHAIYAHQSYFAQFSTPSPLQHTWSLAIEEQFYVVWPLLLLFVLRAARRSWRQVGLALTVVGTAASALAMALLFHPGGDPTRIYYGTDTRAFDLMAGAIVAFTAASRRQPNRRARRTLHIAAPLAAAALAVFWVVAGTSGGIPSNYMFEGGFLLCAGLAAVVVADARLAEPGRFARVLSSPPLHFLGTISYGIYLWHWPVFVYVTSARTGLSTLPLDIVRVAMTLAISTASFYLVERPLRRARPRGWIRYWLAPAAGAVTAVVLVAATTPALADPNPVATTSKANVGSAGDSAGTGGFANEVPIRLSSTISPGHPLRVMLLGDSVMHDASFGITAALESTNEVVVHTNTIDGFGLTTATNWPTSLPTLIRENRPQLIVATWSWDQDGPTTPNALHQRAAYTALLERAIRTMLTPGNGVDGLIFTEFPLSGDIPAADPANFTLYNHERILGLNAWNSVAAEMPGVFPGRVMYLPIAGSVLVGDRFSSWLPPPGDPHAPTDEWTRARKLDNVHLCPEGSARYAQALLSDMTSLFGLPAANPSWQQGAWTSDPDFNDPPGACPADHPPAGYRPGPADPSQ